MGSYVQYGCGLCAPDGWLNFDASPTLRLQKIPVIGTKLAPVKFPANARFGDIRKGLPVPDGSVDGVYCSHVLEHLSFDDMKLALKNTLRILRPGGVFRLVVPDLKVMAADYVNSSDPTAAIQLNNAMLLRGKSRPVGLNGLLRAWIGNSDHLWMWDFPSMELQLKEAGFASVRPAVFGDSGDEMFSKVEDPGRWERVAAAHCRKA